MPRQADQDACGGELGYADEPVPGPGNTEVLGGLPHLRVAQQLTGCREETGRGHEQRDRDEHGNLF
jgi:hypothetical protein